MTQQKYALEIGQHQVCRVHPERIKGALLLSLSAREMEKKKRLDPRMEQYCAVCAHNHNYCFVSFVLRVNFNAVAND